VQRILSFALAISCAPFILALSAIGQEAGVAQAGISAQRPQPGTMTVGIGGGGARRAGPAVTGMPYSVEQVTETVQTLADGTHIRQKQRTTVMYRDSAGRTRMETPIGAQMMNDAATMVRIVDVVGGYEYTLDEQNKIAHRVMVQVAQPMAKRGTAGTTGAFLAQGFVGSGPVPAQRMAAPVPRAVAPGAAGMPRPEIQSEDLGTQSIEGVTARGRRMTQTWPVDSVGNDRPIVVVNETWFSDQLGGMMVLSKNNDPRHGETTTTLKNVNLAEPDPSLFQPPPGYQIVDENGSFQISVPRPSPAAAQKQ